MASKAKDSAQRDLNLHRLGKELAQRHFSGVTSEVVVSPDRRWIWLLGSDGSAVVTLLDAESLQVVDSYKPRSTFCHRDPSPPLLDTWHAHETTVCRDAPDVLVVNGNAGDSFVLFLVLRATSDGIVDEASQTVFNVVSGVLSERICGAGLISSEHLVVVDDIGNLTLFEWPGLEQVAVTDLMSALMGEEDSCSIWPDSRPLEYLLIGWDTIVACDQLLVSIAGDDAPLEVLALASLDAATLKPNGIVRSPTKEMAELRQVGDNLFVATRGSEQRVLQLVPA